MLLVVLLVTVCAMVGCDAKTDVKLEDYLEEIEFVAPLNSTVEVPLGKYSIPIAVRSGDDASQETERIWIRMKFHLYAVVANENESKVEAAWQQNRGLYHDGVLKICRGTTLDEVTDRRLTAIKLRLTDLSRSLLGGKRIRQLLCTNIITEAI
jgi:hypothetical protein